MRPDVGELGIGKGDPRDDAGVDLGGQAEQARGG